MTECFLKRICEILGTLLCLYVSIINGININDSNIKMRYVCMCICYIYILYYVHISNVIVTVSNINLYLVWLHEDLSLFIRHYHFD